MKTHYLLNVTGVHSKKIKKMITIPHIKLWIVLLRLRIIGVERSSINSIKILT